MSMKRRKWSHDEKLRIVLEGMSQDVEVSALCRREGIEPTLYYNWKKKLLASAGAVFSGAQKGSAREEQLAGELHRMKEVVAEITAENLELKKGRWDWRHTG